MPAIQAAGCYSILIMDDEKFVRDVIQGMLRTLGHRCNSTSNGQAAVEVFMAAEKSTAPYDLVILDLTVPGGMGGEVTLQQLLRINPELPAIVMSGYSSEPIMAKYEEYGFRGRLSKPYGMEDLRREVAQALTPRPPRGLESAQD
jgi:CheY-like chemotaxis protein